MKSFAVGLKYIECRVKIMEQGKGDQRRERRIVAF